MTELPTVEHRPDRCETCRFWDDFENIAYRRRVGDSEEVIATYTGGCRRYAPQHILKDVERKKTGLDESLAVWPSTCASDWCGEWQAKKPAPPPADGIPSVLHVTDVDVIDGETVIYLTTGQRLTPYKPKP